MVDKELLSEQVQTSHPRMPSILYVASNFRSVSSLYINGLPSRVKTTPHLFADGHIINSPEDAHVLQADIDALHQWEKDWLMSFIPHKSNIIRIIEKRKPIDATYTTHGKELGHIKNAKYVGSPD